MIAKPHFILVTGPNGAGKSTFIDTNRGRLANYLIVQPDEDRNWRQAIATATLHKSNIVLETPWNSNAINEIYERVQVLDYSTSLYQLYLNHPKQSWERVSERNKIINRILDFDNVIYTFNQNFKNVFKAYLSFDDAYFVNVLTNDSSSLKLAFHKSNIIFLKPNNDNFLITFREIGHKQGYVNDEAFHVMSKNVLFVTEAFQSSFLK